MTVNLDCGELLEEALFRLGFTYLEVDRVWRRYPPKN